MRFLHMADVHLGCAPDSGRTWSGQRAGEIWETFADSVQDAARMRADLVLIAGDLFHTPPDERMLREAASLFASCPDICFALIAGNHDCIAPGSAWERFRFPGNVALLGTGECECITFPRIGCEVYGFSYDRPQIEEPLYDGIRPDENDAFRILLAHGGDASHIPFAPDAMERSGFDYIALGHIHRPQIVLENRAAYSGALTPIDAGDEGPHGYIVGETSGHSVRLRFVPKAKREYVTMTVTVGENDTALSVRGRVAEVVSRRGKENIYKVILRGQRNPVTRFDAQIIENCGMILSVDDRTAPAFHLEKLRRQYRGQLIGRYIESFLREDAPVSGPASGRTAGEADKPAGAAEPAGLTEVERRALQFGLEALLLHAGTESGR